MKKERMSFFKKYYISTFNVDNFSKIAVLKNKGRMYLTFLIFIFSLILTCISLSAFKPMYLDEIKKMPNFKIEKGKIELEKNENLNEKDIAKYNKKLYKIDLSFINIYPNITNRDYIKIKDNIRDLKIEEIEKGKSDLVEKFFIDKAKENDMPESKIKEEIELLDEVPVLILKDGIYFNISTRKYMPLNQFIKEDVLTKKEIINVFDNNFNKIVFVPFYMSIVIVLFFVTIIMKLVAGIYMSLASLIYKTNLYMIPSIRSKISNYGISGAFTLFIILTALSIKNIIQGIDVLLISTFIYIIYLNIITKILLNDVNTIKQIKQFELQTVNGLPIDEFFDNLEKEAKDKKEKLDELKKDDEKEQEDKEESKEEN